MGLVVLTTKPIPNLAQSGRPAVASRVSSPGSSVQIPYIYELLYGVARTRWLVRVVDVLVQRRVVDRAAGLLLGAVTSIGVISDYVVNALADGGTLRGGTTVAIVFGLVACWLAVKAAARSAIWPAVGSSLAALLVAAPLSLVLDPSDPVFPGLVALVGLRWLVIDVVAFTADSSGLLNRLIPKG